MNLNMKSAEEYAKAGIGGEWGSHYMAAFAAIIRAAQDEAFAVGAASVSQWRTMEDAGDDANDKPLAYLVANAKGQVAPLIRGIIHNTVGSPWDWNYGEAITHWMPRPTPPTHGETK